MTLVGGRLPNEDLFNLRQFNDSLGGQAALYSDMAGGDLTAHLGLTPGSNIGEMGAETAIVVVACDLENEAPIWYLRIRAAAKRGAKLVVINPRPTKLDDVAAVVVRYRYGDESAAVRAFLPGAGTAANVPQAALDAVSGAENLVVFYGSEGLGLAGSRDVAEACAALVQSTDRAGRPNNGLVGVWSKNNMQGAFDMGFAPVDDLGGQLAKAGAAYIVAADPAGDDPLLAKALQGVGFVIVQDMFLTPTAQLADIVLPVQSFIEREGTFTSGERRVQRFYPAVASFRGVMADFRITAELGKRLGYDIEGRAPSLIFQRLSEALKDYAGLTYPKLAEVHDQWPLIRRHDLFYGGTGYENRQGLGVQLQPAAQNGRAAQTAGTDGKLSAQAGEVLLTPITRLYDRGTTVLPTLLLHARMARPELWMHPTTASEFSLAHNDHATFDLGTGPVEVEIKLDEMLPKGIALVPRSVGIPVSAPRSVKLQRLAATQNVAL